MRLLWTFVFAALFATNSLYAQNFGELFGVDKVEPAFQIGGADPEVSAILKADKQPGVVVFELTLTIPDGANSYSMAKDFPKPTIIELSGIDGWRALDQQFTLSPKPKRAFDEVFSKEVEKLVGTTVFSRRYLAPQGVNIKNASFNGKIDFLLCDKGSCTPKSEKFKANFDSTAKQVSVAPEPTPPAAPESSPSDEPVSQPAALDSPAKQSTALSYGYELTPTRKVGGESKTDPVLLQFQIIPAEPQTGDEVEVAISMQLHDGWNTYGLVKAETQIETPTIIQIEDVSGLKALDDWTPDFAPEAHVTEVGTSNVHRERVTWRRRFQVTDAAQVGVSGKITYQICKKSCMQPLPLQFALGTLQQADKIAGAVAVRTPLAVSGNLASSAASEESADDLYVVETEGAIESLGVALPLAFIGGLLLNFMPCVLPVLAIKILSLVQQAGESRSRILTLNLSYTAGVLLVFLLLAVVSAAIGWGGQFQNRTYAILMSIIVFSMGLSLLGVFELPIPGLVPSANHHSEGILAAFNTGIVATLLATPCTGPFMGVVIAFAASQPTIVNFLIFGTMGLGMASPYLIAGFFPKIVNWLPKPGMWMVRFKQFAGFVLMGTVIWLMNVSLDAATHVPLLILLLGVAVFLWMIGLGTASGKTMLGRPLLNAALLAAPMIAYGIYDIRTTPESTATDRVAAKMGRDEKGPEDISEMPWEPFSEARMTELRQQGVPMLIDFTADWCGVCKANELWALNRKPTVEFVRKNGIVPLVADYTQEDAEIRKWLERFGVQSVPLAVIFPADKTQNAVAIPGPYTMDGIIDRLEKAVATKSGDTQSSSVTMAD